MNKLASERERGREMELSVEEDIIIEDYFRYTLLYANIDRLGGTTNYCSLIYILFRKPVV